MRCISQVIRDTEIHKATEVKGSMRTPQLEALADSILHLNMIEVSELQKILAERTGVDLAAMQAAPVMAAGGAAGAAAAGGAAAGAAAAPAEAAAAPVAAAKDTVTMKLVALEEGKKFPVLKILRKLAPGQNLLESKKMVEELPSTIASDIPNEEAAKWVAEIKEAGGTVELV